MVSDGNVIMYYSTRPYSYLLYMRSVHSYLNLNMEIYVVYHKEIELPLESECQKMSYKFIPWCPSSVRNFSQHSLSTQEY